MSPVDRAAVFRGEICGIEDVLHANRDAMEQPARGPRVELARLPADELRIDRGPGAQLAVARRDLGEKILGHFGRGQLAARDAARELARAELMGFH